MDKRDFMIIIQLLNAYYLDWKFDTNDRLLCDTWYQFLQGMGFERLKKVASIYINRNDHGPNSPSDLRKIEAELILKDMIHNGEPN